MPNQNYYELTDVRKEGTLFGVRFSEESPFVVQLVDYCNRTGVPIRDTDLNKQVMDTVRLAVKDVHHDHREFVRKLPVPMRTFLGSEHTKTFELDSGAFTFTVQAMCIDTAGDDTINHTYHARAVCTLETYL